MTRETVRIPFEVDVGRIIEVLAKQIYQSPLALLRENTQNAFDAILLRAHRDPTFQPRIDVRIDGASIVIADNGIGMTMDDLRSHYWKAGSSSKNNDEARSAGVVGTFGIGAMANFGIADRLVIETESVDGERTLSEASKATLSTTEDTILLAPRPSTGIPGTTVRAEIGAGNLDVPQAVAYITEFVAFVDTPVYVNDELVSRRRLDEAVPSPSRADGVDHRASISSNVQADVRVAVAPGTGDVWVKLTNIAYAGEHVEGSMILRQGGGAIRTFRSGFGLATVSASSHYSLGGVADLRILQPTAGRESLTTASIQLLQEIVSGLDALLSEEVAGHGEADVNTAFQEWARRNGRFDLCGNLRARVEPDNRRLALSEIQDLSRDRPVLVYAGSDAEIITSIASEDRPLVVEAATNPRRACEAAFLEQFCQIERVNDAPTVLTYKDPRSWTSAERAVVFRISTILQTDYFLSNKVRLGKLSHGLPLVVLSDKVPAELVLDTGSSTFATLVQLYESEFDAFGSMVKDVVRNVVFPRVADLVPSSTRQGAEAFLKSIRRTKDVFEYELGDLDSLTDLWGKYLAGQLTMEEATARATAFVQRNVQEVDLTTARAIRDVLPDVVENEAAIRAEAAPGPAPAILRSEVETDAKLLTIPADSQDIKGFRTFIAISDRTYEERGEFFLQPHATSVVWGGQKVLFIFEHHSGEFGLYYDLQTSSTVSPVSGGGPYPTATIVLKNRIFIPIPEPVANSFIPSHSERKRFEVKSDLLYTERRRRASAAT